MAHLFMAISGADHVVEIVKKNLSSQAFWTERRNMITGTKEKIKVQGVWRPIELGHYVFPEEATNEVLHMLSIPEKMKTFEAVPNINKFTLIMRKLLKLKKIPDMSELPALTPEQMTQRTIFWHEHTNIIPLGIKEDGRGIRKFSDGSVYDQEWL